MEKQKKGIRAVKNDIVLLGGFVLIGAVFLLLVSGHSQGGRYAQVRVNGSVTAVYSLSENRTVQIKGVGGSNLLVIRDGEVFMQEADCPDALCVHQGKITLKGQSIICLPHRVVVEITDNDGTDTAASDIDIIVK